MNYLDVESATWSPSKALIPGNTREPNTLNGRCRVAVDWCVSTHIGISTDILPQWLSYRAQSLDAIRTPVLKLSQSNIADRLGGRSSSVRGEIFWCRHLEGGKGGRFEMRVDLLLCANICWSPMHLWRKIFWCRRHLELYWKLSNGRADGRWELPQP